MEFESIDLINLTYDMVFIIDKKGYIKFANNSAEENLFYSKDEFNTMNLNEILFESDKFLEILDTIILSAGDSDKTKDRFNSSNIDLSKIKEAIGYQDLILISKDTNLKIMMANFQARKIIYNGLEYLLLILRDITDRKFFEQELFKITENLELLVQEKTIELQKKNEMLEKLATRDTLTNLLNIRKFREILTMEIDLILSKPDTKNDRYLSLMMIDADHFKYYNDTFGHRIGDEVIKGIGRLLAKSVKKIDYVARYGGDEFIILFPRITYEESVTAGLRIKDAIKDDLKIKTIIKEILDIDNVVIPPEHEISLSIGVSRYRRGKSMDELINEADNALYKSKESGRNCIHINNIDGSIVKVHE